MLSNIKFMLIFTAILLLPDFIVNIYWDGYYEFMWYRFIRELSATVIVGFIISFTPRIFITILTSFLILISFIVIAHYGYFHTYIMPYEIYILKDFDDIKDIWYSLVDIKYLLFLLLFLWISLTYFIYKIDIYFKPIKKKYALYFLITVLVVYPYFINKKKNLYLANFTHFSYLNGLNTIYLSFLDYFKEIPHKAYKPYHIEKIDKGKPIVIMIMGESLNYKRMHLFGWDINNTPRLDVLAKNDKNFIYKKAISSSVRTICSVTSFFYNKREPYNMQLLLNNETNIMKLANQNGYDTYWLSMQSDISLISKIINYSKHKKFEWNFKKKYDEELLKEFKKIPFNKKTFIVFHIKAVHSPYNRYVPKRFQLFKKDKRAPYYNGILYNDYFIYEIIKFMKKNYKDFVIYFTSDHGEMLGFDDEDGKYGHSQLVLGDTYVPFIYYSDKYHKNLNKKLYNHYMISKMLTEDLGYKLINPNNDNNIFYINGIQINGSAGYIKYKIENDKVKILK